MNPKFLEIREEFSTEDQEGHQVQTVERVEATAREKLKEIEASVEVGKEKMDEILEGKGRVCASDWIYKNCPNWKAGQRKNQVHDTAEDNKQAKAFTRWVHKNELLEKERLECTTIGRGGSFVATYPPAFLDKYYPIFLAQYTASLREQK